MNSEALCMCGHKYDWHPKGFACFICKYNCLRFEEKGMENKIVFGFYLEGRQYLVDTNGNFWRFSTDNSGFPILVFLAYNPIKGSGL